MANRNLDDYVSVHSRVEKFRTEHPTGRILTAIVSSEPLTFRAEVYLSDSEVPNATGHASADGGMGNRSQSAIEKTETAAVGRALAFCGYEIKQGIASKEEMQSVNPEFEHKRLDAAIRAQLKRIGKSDNNEFNKGVGDKFETDGEWTDLSLEYKSDLLEELKKMKAK